MSQAPDTPSGEHQQVLEARPPTVDDALALTRVMPIIPLRPLSKAPRLLNWQQRASTDPAIIRQWWHMWPDSSVGYVIPHGVLVIDVDPRHNGLVGWKNLLVRHGDVSATWRVWTGRQDGGFHLHFSIPEAVQLPEATDLDQGVQVLGHRHLVVLPPSLHPNTGKAYMWDEVYNPFTMPTPAPAPAWLLTLTLETAKPHRFKPSERSQGSLPGKPSSGDSSTGTSTKVLRGGGKALGTLVEASPGKNLGAQLCAPGNLVPLLQACGLPPEAQVGWTLPCPFHPDEHPSASLLGPTMEHRSYGLYCHSSACQRYYSLVDIYKAKTSGNVLSIHSETDSRGVTHDHAVLRLQWATRLLEAAGIIHLYELGCPSLPSNAPAPVRAVWETFLHVRRIRSATRKVNAPLPLSWRFIMDWMGPACAWGQYALQRAKSWLIARGFWHIDHEESGMTFWAIGSKALRRMRGGADILPTERANVESVDATPVPEPVAHTGHAWSATAPAPARVCPLSVDDPTHDEASCVLWQAWLRSEEKTRLYGSSRLLEVSRVAWEAVYE